MRKAKTRGRARQQGNGCLGLIALVFLGWLFMRSCGQSSRGISTAPSPQPPASVSVQTSTPPSQQIPQNPQQDSEKRQSLKNIVYFTSTDKERRYHNYTCAILGTGGAPIYVSKAREYGFKPCAQCGGIGTSESELKAKTEQSQNQYQPTYQYQQPTPSYQQPQHYQPQPNYDYESGVGSCPQGGRHVAGKTDRNGRLHCAKCGRFM